MSRAFARATPAVLDREDFIVRNTFFHQPSDRHYRMIRRGDRFFQRRHQLGFKGAESNVIEKEIHYVMGSGNHARTYLHRTPDNRLLQLPLGWYPEAGGQWAMNPGYDRPDHSGFRREIGFGCAEAQEAASVYPTVLPEGIDCQRCHGPGAAHVEAASKGDTNKIKSTILQPKSLDRNRQLEVCLQCHLESTSFSLPHAALRLGRGVFSYSPAEPLSSYAIHFDHASGSGHEGKFEIVSAAYRLRQSLCFAKSEMTCTTCHPAHHAPRGVAATQHYNGACRQCHKAEKLPSTPAHRRAAPDCSSCHMPKRRTEDVVHAVMTDHFIQRRTPTGDLTAPRAERIETSGINSYRGEVALYYPPSLPKEADRDLYTALAQVVQKSNLKAGIGQLETAIAKHNTAGQPFVPHLAAALLSDGQSGKARAIFMRILERSPRDTGALRGLADTETAPERSLEVLRRLLAEQPGDAAALYQMARFTRQISDAAKAVGAAPESPDALNLLGSLHQDVGQTADADRLFREAIRHQPDLAPLHENLAGVLEAEGRFDEALFEFDAAVRLDPQSAGARFGKAAALAALARFTEAQSEGQTAVKLSPNHAAAWELLGNLAARQARWAEASGHFQKALAAQPGLARAELGLGTVLAAQRDLAGARQHLERAAAAADPAVRQEALELLREIALRHSREMTLLCSPKVTQHNLGLVRSCARKEPLCAGGNNQRELRPRSVAFTIRCC